MVTTTVNNNIEMSLCAPVDAANVDLDMSINATAPNDNAAPINDANVAGTTLNAAPGTIEPQTDVPVVALAVHAPASVTDAALSTSGAKTGAPLDNATTEAFGEDPVLAKVYSLQSLNEGLDIDCIHWDTLEETNDLSYIKFRCRQLDLPTTGNITDLKILLFQHSIKQVLTTLAVVTDNRYLTPNEAEVLTGRSNKYISSARASITAIGNTYTTKKKEQLVKQDSKIQKSLDGVLQGLGMSAIVMDIPSRILNGVWVGHEVDKKPAAKTRKVLAVKGPKGSKGGKGGKSGKDVEIEYREEGGDLAGVEPFAGVEEKDLAFKAPTKKRKLSPAAHAATPVTPRRSGRNQK